MAEEDTSSHHSGTRQGEDIKDDEGKESGRTDEGTTHADRPAGGSDVRDSTAINPDDMESVTGGKTMPPA